MKNIFTIVILLIFIFVSTSFAQLFWTKDTNNPIMSGGAAGTWHRHVFMPNVLYNSDSLRFEMWYGASGGPPWRPYRIGFAASDDGINWTKLDTAVLNPTTGTWDEPTVEGQMVLRENGQYKMWYTSWSSTSPDRIGLATSPNGTDWTKYSGNPILGPGTSAWEVGGVGYCNVMPILGGGYKMWYTGQNANYTKAQIGYATSADGISWQRDSLNNPVLTTGASGEWDDEVVGASQVLIINDIYYMWYTGFKINGSRAVGLAISTDGINWNKYNDPNTTSTLYASSDPVLKPTSGQWDRNYIEGGTVMLVGDSLRMWYDGSREPTPTYLWRIGHATAPFNTIFVPTNYPTIQAAINASTDGDVVLVADGTYLENINFKGKAITVASHYYFDGDTSHISNTIIDGSNPSHPDSGSVVTFNSGEDTTSVLCGFTITGGTGTFQAAGTPPQPPFPVRIGGGILVGENMGAKITRNIIEYNSITVSDYAAGGGINADIPGGAGFTIIEQNKIHHNDISGEITYTSGGGIFLGGSGRIIKNEISGNSVRSVNADVVGGGIRLMKLSGSPAIAFCRIEDNVIRQNMAVSTNGSAHAAGLNSSGIEILLRGNQIVDNVVDAAVESWSAGMHVGVLSAASSRIENNRFSGNSSLRGTCFGGALYIVSSSLTLANNVFDHNSAHLGGALYWNNSQITFMNNTMVDNHAFNSGGGVYASQSTFDIINSILWGNTASTSSQIYRVGGSETVSYSDIQGGWTGTGNIDSDPFFTDTLLYNLSVSSPCVGTGIDSIQIGGTWYYCPATDFAGNPRPNSVDDLVDMGALESSFPNAIIKEDSEYLPKTFSLKQNYPNPFNPSTTIEFSIPKAENVVLKIYNLLGQEVATLVSEKITPGAYKYTWDASQFASGVYFYKLEAGSFVKSRKLILMK